MPTAESSALLSFDDALGLVLDAAAGLRATTAADPAAGTHGPATHRRGVEALGLSDAHTRVLAREIRADRDQPPFDRSTRDGFATHLAAAVESATTTTSALSRQPSWRVVGRLFAGESWGGAAVGSGEAVEIMTGAPLPEGASAVVMIEHVVASPGGAEADALSTIVLAAGRTITPGANIVPRGREATANAVVLPAHARLGPAEIAVAATCGAATVEVFTRPRVAIIATGDELVEISAAPEPQQIRNSNSYALAALVTEAGGTPWQLPIARDTHASLLAAIDEARCGADLLLLSGGVSMGKHDLVEEVLLSLGATFHFTGVRMQPGKPVVFGSLPSSAGALIPLFGLPGNPISTEVTFRCFVAPILRSLGGEQEIAPRFVQAHLSEDVAVNRALTRLLPAHLTGDHTGATVRLVAWQGSGDLAANARANCYAVLPADRDAFRTGDLIAVLLR